LSSAILYVAIVAIWACVLIPRWLRRDSSVSVPVSSPADDQGTSGADEEPEPSARHRDHQAEAEERTAPAEERSVPREERSVPGSVPGEERSAVGESRDLPSDPGHRRVLSARRRLLLLLVALTIASGVLAGIGLAAWWVTVPPSVMLVCYLLLLRAAAKADAERRELAHDQAYTRAAHAAAAAAAAPPVRPARPVRAEVLTFSGASALEAQDDEEIYDQYADAKLRAVGD
jgi:hypothetical protein